MKSEILCVLLGVLMLSSLQAQEGFTLKDLHEWSRSNHPSENSKSVLSVGEQLNTGQRLLSANKAYRLIMQEDGNLCIYKTANNAFVWCSMAHGFSGAFLIMQQDGNLVVYDGNKAAKWSSKTHPYFSPRFRNRVNRPVRLVLENDGHLRLYNSAGRSVWSNQ